MFRLFERDSTAETPVVGDGRREMSIELLSQKEANRDDTTERCRLKSGQTKKDKQEGERKSR